MTLLDGKVVGGCGLTSFNGSPEVCELKKLFILPEGRGHGLGKRMAIACLDYARTQGWLCCRNRLN
nr:GNAT family N-acetyltransferase [Vibrio maritimus]